MDISEEQWNDYTRWAKTMGPWCEQLARLAKVGQWAERHQLWQYLEFLDSGGEYRGTEIPAVLADRPKE